ncbi:MAG TPA: mechanosensitive ion channel family protein [Syntrophales bacterium]|nr:mechanosensitive ion channel family protein [Syntrophales bacterium]HPX56603.1 mechanosensitive ion channel family protein [Syntrophales bacterium]HQN77307.1 mechanosensitive ion channel family protein [Syntrophales bacterium]HQQ26295.1 mechanosensitive ion channel family protein [Syntrophales bacterium]
MESLTTLLRESVLNNTLEKWLIALGIVIAGTVALNILLGILGHTLAALERKWPGDIAQTLIRMFRGTKRYILFIIALYAGSTVLSLPNTLATFLRYVAVIFAGIQIGVWASFLVTRLVSEYIVRTTGDEEVPSGTGIATLVARIVIWVFIVLLVLDNLGFNITTLVAGLGVGGIAVAMASQSVLADLFASLSILLDKPFKVGEFIIVGDMMGSVENIGLKTTRVRSLGGEQLVFSNADLLSSRIRNYRRMEERRVVFTIGVEYSTSYEKLKRIPGMIKDIILSVDHTRFDRSHFMNYGDFSLNVETVFYVLSSDYNLYADVRQEINLALFKKFEDEGIVFAFPSQTVYLAGDGKKSL